MAEHIWITAKDLSISLTKVKCDGLSVGRVHDTLSGPLVTITGGQFSSPLPAMLGWRMSTSEDYKMESSPFEFPTVVSLDSVGQIEGSFSSPTQVSGTVNIWMWAAGTDRACELGTFAWGPQSP